MHLATVAHSRGVGASRASSSSPSPSPSLSPSPASAHGHARPRPTSSPTFPATSRSAAAPLGYVSPVSVTPSPTGGRTVAGPQSSAPHAATVVAAATAQPPQPPQRHSPRRRLDMDDGPDALPHVGLTSSPAVAPGYRRPARDTHRHSAEQWQRPTATPALVAAATAAATAAPSLHAPYSTATSPVRGAVAAGVVHTEPSVATHGAAGVMPGGGGQPAGLLGGHAASNGSGVDQAVPVTPERGADQHQPTTPQLLASLRDGGLDYWREGSPAHAPAPHVAPPPPPPSVPPPTRSDLVRHSWPLQQHSPYSVSSQLAASTAAPVVMPGEHTPAPQQRWFVPQASQPPPPPLPAGFVPPQRGVPAYQHTSQSAAAYIAPPVSYQSTQPAHRASDPADLSALTSRIDALVRRGPAVREVCARLCTCVCVRARGIVVFLHGCTMLQQGARALTMTTPGVQWTSQASTMSPSPGTGAPAHHASPSTSQEAWYRHTVAAAMAASPVVPPTSDQMSPRRHAMSSPSAMYSLGELGLDLDSGHRSLVHSPMAKAAAHAAARASSSAPRTRRFS